jgi:hypothetical protein
MRDLELLKKIRRTLQPSLKRKNIRAELLRRNRPENLVCAEIGVWQGKFSRRILECSPRQLHLVDPWQFRPDLPLRGYGGKRARSQTEMDEMAAQVQELAASDPRVIVHRVPSSVFFDTTTELFDWIYIDGDHRYEAVLADLRGAWRVVRPGGTIAGDDYLFNKTEERDFPIKRAVGVFSRERNAPFTVIRSSQFVFTRV